MPPEDAMRVGVVGTGHLGREHARIYAALPGVQLVGVHDLDGQAAQQAAERSGSVAMPFEALVDSVAAVSVCVPTPAHADVAGACLDAGLHVLVEKPITDDLESARALVRKAAKRQRLLQVGHIERFNPAMVAAAQYLERPRFVESHRLSRFGRRGADVAVVLDLMIHDLDLVLSLVGEPVESIDAAGVAVLSGSTDIASVRLRFQGGCVANLTASRISLERMRKIRFFQSDSYLSVDLLQGEVAMYRKRAGFDAESFQAALLRGENPDPLAAIEPVPIRVEPEEPLRLELQAFVDCVERGGRPAVDGEAGIRALEVACEIERLLRAGA
jgi:predicted dehydrogenase